MTNKTTDNFISLSQRREQLYKSDPDKVGVKERVCVLLTTSCLELAIHS